MFWAYLIDAALWLIILVACHFLGAMVYRRRDIPGRLFLAMLVALVVAEIPKLLASMAGLWSVLAPSEPAESFVALTSTIWPITAAAHLLFACLTLHYCLTFPSRSRILDSWRWSPLLFYVPGSILAAAALAALLPATDGNRLLESLARPRLYEGTPQLAFITLAIGLGLTRLASVYRSTRNPIARQQISWLVSGCTLGGLVIVITNYAPRAFGQSLSALLLPGMQQLPILVMLAGFALATTGYHLLDVKVVISRSVAYAALAAAITLIYLAVAGAMSLLFSRLASEGSEQFIAVLTTLIVVLVALPLRDRIQHNVDRLFLRSQHNYQQLIQEYSRRLTMLVALPRLLSTAADQLDDVFHPSGLAIVLADNGNAFRVMLARGRLATSSLWREGATFDIHHFAASHLAGWGRPFYLPVHIGAAPAVHKAQWLGLQRSGAELFVPMHLRGNLTGWLVLGPRLAQVAYDRADLDFLAALADQSCVALENGRLYTTMQQRATELAMVSMVSAAISSSLDLEYVLQTIVESIIQVIGCDRSAIFELDEEGRELNLRMAKGLSQAYIACSAHLSVGKNARAVAIVTRQPLIVPDIEAELSLAGLVPLARLEGFRSVIDVPLIGRRAGVGVLSVYFADPHTPSPGELEILTTFASQAAVAIENARLYATANRERDRATSLYQKTDAALSQRVEELTAIEEISRQLTSTLDLRRVMGRVLERTLQAVPAQRAIISLYERDRHQLFLLVQTGYPAEMERYQLEPWLDSRGITGRVARTGQPALAPDVSQDADYERTVDSTASQLSVPIIHGRVVTGVITLESDVPAAFTGEQVRFVQLVAEHAAVAMANAQLFQEVTEARDRLQAILNSTRDAVLVLDPNGQVILANPGVRALVGPDAEEWLWLHNPLDLPVLRASSLAWDPTMDAEGLVSALRDVRDRPEQVTEIAFSFQDRGRRRYVDGTASPVLSASGQVIGRVAVLRDVTHQHELEQFREDLTGMLIHNLQGPLAAIISSLEMLRDDYQVGEPEQAELVRIALTSGRRLFIRIESLLKIRQLEERKVPLDIQLLPLDCVVQPVLQEYLPSAAARHISLSAHVPPDLPPVAVDEEIVGRLFSNLLDNALKYTPAMGQIQVEATLHSDGQSPRILCAVSDTGCGIPPDEHQLIFEQFRRGTEPAEGRRTGSGIGLHYCRLAVQAHGGRIWVDSQPGRGSTFYFTLPVSESGKESASA